MIKNLKAGMRIVAGHYAPGLVVEVDGDECMVRWDDSDEDWTHSTMFIENGYGEIEDPNELLKEIL